MTLNVNRAIQDQFYRYKMPRLMAKVEGKGNGVKTVIPNMVEIARSLGRPATYCCKYFGCELGAQTQFDFKNERYIVNGAHDAAKLQDMLDGFIKKFVLCEKCDNPETVLKVYLKKGIITASCKACGHSFTLDMRHKLTTYIIRNPPEQDPNVQGSTLTGKKEKKSERKRNDQDKSGDDKNGDDDTNGGDEDEEQWATDTSEQARKDRMKGLTSGVKGLAMDDDMEKPESERINIFHDFLKAKVVGGLVSNAQNVKDVFVEAERLEVTNKAVLVLCEVLLNDDKIIAKIESHKLMFLRFTNENQKAQKYLLGGIEKTVEARKDALLAKVPLIFKAFYDNDILDEEVIVEWSKKVSKKHVPKELAEKIHKNAAPFVTWLMEAEEEEDSDDSDVELEFNERARDDVLKEVKDKVENGKDSSPPAKASSEEPSDNKKDAEEDDEDLDIDDI